MSLWSACACFLIGIALAATWPRPASAEEIQRVRATTPRLQEILEEGITGSETMRDMVDAIQRSDLIVFIAPQIPPSDLVWGELHFAATAPGVRYLRVRVRQDVSRAQLVGLLAHELQHATEVAAAPDVVDTKTLDDLYDRIGFELSRGQHETDAARAVGDRVRREVSEYNEGLSRKY